jgi:formylmethanofuran dehydrogenase subunit E
MQAYQILPDEELLTITAVQLIQPVEHIVSRPGVRVECAACGEEIINEREVKRGSQLLCKACAGQSYYQNRSAISAFPRKIAPKRE